jgi:uncharacterized protein (TIGR00255 family)
MIYSMTGYGKGSAGNENLTVDIEVKSVNSRYLDISLKIPSSLMILEYELREIIKSKIKRGKLTVVFQLKKNGSEEIPALDKEKLKAYLALIKELKKAAKINEKVKLQHLLEAKEIFSSEGSQLVEKEFNLIKEALDKALNALLKMKKNEGEELAKDLVNRIKSIEEKIVTIESESLKSAQEYFQILKDRTKLLVEDVTSYTERLELELALIAEKSEITEECVRLKSHLKFFMESLQNDDDPGRKLNFLCQEMNREVNTISSKSISTVITHSAVLIKEEIERIREQIQNVD